MLVNPLNRNNGLMGEMLNGGLAEKCLVAQHQLIRMPDGVTFEEAASLPVAYGTAHRMLITHHTVKQGDKVLVLGASGGVGTGCVLLAKMLRRRSDRMRVQRGQDPAAERARRRSRHQLQGDGLLQVGDREVRQAAAPQLRRAASTSSSTSPAATPGSRSLRCVKRGGKILVCGATAGYDPKEDLRYIWSFELQVIGSNSFYDDNLQALMGLIAQGKMKPVIDKVLPLEDAAEGVRLIQDREVFGKVVVTP